MSTSIEKSILSRIRGHGRGWSFSAKDFSDIGARSGIDIALHRLEDNGTIRRAMRGIYDFPKKSILTGQYLSPDIWSIAQTIARKNGWKIIPSGETALNALGLSTQVPGTYIFFTNGQSKKYTLGKRHITFRKKTPRDLYDENGNGAMVIQALKTLGKDRVDENTIKTLREKLTKKERQSLLNKTQYGTDWIYEIIKKIALENKNG